jgi:hypothetical protein
MASSITTLHTTAGLLLSRAGPGQFLDGRPDTAGSGVGGPVGGTLSSGLKKYPNTPGQWLGTLPCVGCRLSNGMLNGCPDSEVIKDPMALIVRVGVLTPVSWLIPNLALKPSRSPNNPQFTIGSLIPLLSPVNYSPGCCCKWECVLSHLTW